jgi:hypothetical protein
MVMELLSDHGAPSPGEGSQPIDRPKTVPEESAELTSVLDRRGVHAPGVWEVRREPRTGPDGADQVEVVLDPALLADLDAPGLVVSEGYVGADRRADGLLARVLRSVHGRRPRLARFDLLVAVVVAVLVAAAGVLVVAGHGRPSSGVRTEGARPERFAVGHVPSSAGGSVSLVGSAAGSTDGGDPSPTTTAPVPTATVTPSGPAAIAPGSGSTSAATASTTPTTTPPPAAATTPAQLGAEALALVRYPWQSIPGYTIQFLPISDAPSATFYGNTTFTWGHVGGTSDLYVYPGETAQTLAGITAFEIGHEVDAAAVEPQGGETQIENILGVHPASWAPNCDCAEQGYLSGWYAAAFSNYWSPGVGNWSTIAPEPAGALISEIEPWLNPSIP